MVRLRSPLILSEVEVSMVRLHSPLAPRKIKSLVLNSYAKLNLYLEVLNIRRDNYHKIQTIFERIDLKDTIILKPRPDKLIKIICKNSSVPKDNSNLCYRSARLLQKSFNVSTGLDIKIIKCIPVGSGLGGGSSNAAGVLLGLNKLWKLNLSGNTLAMFAKAIGCDVPFFIYNTPFARACGRGDRVRPLRMPKYVRLWHILVVPKIKVSTSRIYKKWDTYSESPPHLLRIKRDKNFKGAGLTRPKYDVKILFSTLRKNGFSLRSGILFNSLEQITLKLYPEVKRIKEKLASLGLKSILMSGSGPAVFGIVTSRKEAVSLSRQLKRKHKSWQVFVTRTI